MMTPILIALAVWAACRWLFGLGHGLSIALALVAGGGYWWLNRPSPPAATTS